VEAFVEENDIRFSLAFGPILVENGRVVVKDEYALGEAEECYCCYVKRMGKEPPVEVFDEFFWLFGARDGDKLTPGQHTKMKLVGNYDTAIGHYLSSKPLFSGYDAFLAHMRNILSTDKGKNYETDNQ